MNLKQLRSDLGLTQQDLALVLKTTQQTIARWESGHTTLNADQIRNLCVALECTAAELLGWGELDEPKTISFSPDKSEEPFGTLHLQMLFGHRAYPIGVEARASLLQQMGSFDPMNLQSRGSWLETWSLDNKLLFINPAHLRSFRLVTDYLKAMPRYENAEEPDERSGGNEPLGSAAEFRITYIDGSDEWSHLSDVTANSWYDVITAKDVGQNCFVQTAEDGSDVVTFTNLAAVAVVEIPADAYFELTSDDRPKGYTVSVTPKDVAKGVHKA